MSSFRPLLLRFPGAETLKVSTFSCCFNHSLAVDHIPFYPQICYGADSPTQNSNVDTAKIMATHVSNCTNLQELGRIYAHIIRTHFLEIHSASFHWNNILRSYTNLGSPTKALCTYIAMSQAGVMPDSYTLPIVLKALSHVFNVVTARQVHTLAIKQGLENNMFCESGFISLYSKAGEFEDARKVFEQNRERKLGSWNAIIAGLTQGGRAKEAVEMFLEMKGSGCIPDDVTMVSVTPACGSLGNLDLALQLHKCVIQARKLEKSDMLMSNSLIDMYGKCGRMDLAYAVFSRMDERNVSSWTSMIVGYAMNGHVNEALECFHCMMEASVTPNHVTFVGVLTACVHGGSVREGKYYFNLMKEKYGIVPKLQHYGCVVDLLGRAGLFEEAKQMIEGMPVKANVVIWGCLMGACEKYGNIEMGEWVAKHLQELEPWNDGSYVVLSNIYANHCLWIEVDRIRGAMRERNLAKIPGYSLATSPD